MTDELQRQLAELMKSLLATATDAGAWARTQIPPLVQEKILYGRMQHTILGVLFAVVTWRAAVAAQLFYRQASAAKVDTKYGDIWPERPGGIASIVAAVVTIGAAFFAIDHLQYAVMAWVTPRLFIVEWLVYEATGR